MAHGFTRAVLLGIVSFLIPPFARADVSFATAEVVEHRTVLEGGRRFLRLRYKKASCNWFDARIVTFEREGTLVMGVVAVANNLVDCAEAAHDTFGEVSWELPAKVPSRLGFIGR